MERIYCKIVEDTVTDRVVFDGSMPKNWPEFALWRHDDNAQIGWLFVNGELIPPEEPPTTILEAPISLCEIAGAKLSVDQDIWDVTGVERSKGINGAFLVDVDTIWVLFSEPQSDTNYIVIPSDGVTKYEDYVEVTRPGLTEVAFIVQRVQ